MCAQVIKRIIINSASGSNDQFALWRGVAYYIWCVKGGVGVIRAQ